MPALGGNVRRCRSAAIFSLKKFPTNGGDPLQAAPSQPRTIKPEDRGDFGETFQMCGNVISIDPGDGGFRGASH